MITPESPKPFPCSLSILAALLLALLPAHAEVSPVIDRDGIADFIPYTGAQPDLVRGAHGRTVEGRPVVRHAYLVAPHVLAITVDEFGFRRHGPVPYEPRPGDVVTFHGSQVIPRVWEPAGMLPWMSEADRARPKVGHFRFVTRDGEPLGHLVGREGKLLWPVEPVLGTAWDREAAQDVRSYRLERNSGGGAGDADAWTPEAVLRKTKPHGKSNTGPGYSSHIGYQHQLYLVFSRDLPLGETVRLRFNALGLEQEEVEILLDDRRLRTEAIQVSQAGYHPAQTVKRAFLSTWTGVGGSLDYEWAESFEVVREDGGEVVFTGRPERIAEPHLPEFTTPRDGAVHLREAFTYALDFGALDTPGVYRVRVPGLGVSFPFAVTADLWDEAARLQMLGYYHQRSGLPLGPPASQWTRPRNFHPEDRPIHDTDRAKYFDRSLYSEGDWKAGNPFARLQASMMFDTNLADAWGGWADAADYDRRRPHWRAVMAMLFLFELDPAHFEGWALDLPPAEAANAIPDILDEALWCTELFRRTQLPTGEVIEGIESVQHPNRGEASWNDSLPTAVKPGTPSTAVEWAGVAARMAMALRPYDPERAAAYLDSARQAMRFAQANRDHPWYADFQPSDTDRLVAGVYLYQATGEERWHALFKQGWRGLAALPGAPLNPYYPYPLLSYALLEPGRADPAYQRAARRAIRNEADARLRGIAENTGWLNRRDDGRVNFSIVEQLGSEFLIAAHLLTGDPAYVDGLLMCSHFSMGANPLNLCYTTALGHRFIEPFYLDYEYAGKPVPAGIPAYGPVRLDRPLPEGRSWGWHRQRAESYADALQPGDIRRWPLLEQYFRYVGYPAMNEYTVQQGMREQLTRWGYLSLLLD